MAQVVSTRVIPKSTSDWLVKRSKIEKKLLLHTKLTYITAILFHMVATQIQALVVPSHQLLQSLITERRRQGTQPVVDYIHELLVGFEALVSQPDLHLCEEMVIAWRQVRAVRGVLENLPLELLE
jgi:hypothetical protein